MNATVCNAAGYRNYLAKNQKFVASPIAKSVLRLDERNDMEVTLKIIGTVLGAIPALAGIIVVNTPGLEGVGVVSSLVGFSIVVAIWYEPEPEPEIDVRGVHWFWWIFWLVVFFPALIVVAIVHTNKKDKAIMLLQNKVLRESISLQRNNQAGD